ncbi:MAG TPA: fluoride efflux transporter CrcB [Cyclobacteriaceae bacterium]|nr:fluoride efflux transporter CrcB [Cyclobacteriaceae bacterium]
MVRTLILIGIGGGIGSILRYVTTLFANRLFATIFPIGTFAVNFVGCLLIGVFMGLFEKQQLISSDWRALLVVGLCGGYTTFSSFTSESVSLFQADNTMTSFLYIGGSVILGLFDTWLGLSLTRL